MAFAARVPFGARCIHVVYFRLALTCCMIAIAQGRLISFCSYVASQGCHRLQKPCSSQPSIRWLVNEAAEGSAQFTGNAPNKRGSDLRRSLLVGPGCFAKISAGSPSSCVCSKRRKQRMKTIFLWWRVSCGNMSMQAAIPKSRLSTLLSPCTPECDSWTRHWLHSPS